MPKSPVKKIKRVLLVEDEPPLFNIVSAKLKKAGFNVKVAKSVDEAKAALESSDKIDAIWLDHYLLGSQTGLELVTQLSPQPTKPLRIPVFVITNTAGSETEDEYKKRGVVRVYNKAESRLDDIVADIQRHVNG